MEDFFQVGIYTNTHGIRGEIKVFPTTDDPKRFKKLKQVIMRTPKEDRIYTIEQVRFAKQMVLLKFKDVDNINDIERYKGSGLFVPRAEAVPLGKDEYFIADLIGITVSTEEGRVLGQLQEVLQTGANDVYVIALDTGGELLLPAIKQCILDVDVDRGTMRVHVLEGLMP